MIMPDRKYILGITGAFLVGVASLLAAIGIVFLFWEPLFALISMALPFIAGSLLIIVAVVIVWVLVYAFAMIGVAIYYAIRHPMKVNTSPAGVYGLSGSGIKEAGKGGRGASKKSAARKPSARKASRKPRAKKK